MPPTDASSPLLHTLTTVHTRLSTRELPFFLPIFPPKFNMAFSRVFLIALLLFITAVHLVESRSALGDIEMNNGRSLLQYPQQINCTSACQTRCSNNWKNKMCLKMCGVCCTKCNCVPPGTGQDTRNVCPCYDQMRSPRNQKPKCP